MTGAAPNRSTGSGIVHSPLRVDPHTPTTAHVGPARGPLRGRVDAQPSKNYTTRHLLAAAMAPGESLVHGAATSEDAHALIGALRRLGATVEQLPGGAGTLRVVGVGGAPILTGDGPVDVGNAGAVLRLLLGIGALLPEVTFATPFPESLGKRPNGDLLAALEQLGCATTSREGGCLPITLRGGTLRGGNVTVSGARSSQFLSGLLFLAPLIGETITITVADHLVSKPPVRQTLETLAASGIEVDASENLMRIRVQPGDYRAGERRVNGDWPGSAALLAAGAMVAESRVDVAGLQDDEQGERGCVDVLRAMGAAVLPRPGSPEGYTSAPGAFGAAASDLDFDGDPFTDAVLALLAPACLRAGRTRFHNVANLRIKECDRITEPLRELRKIGVVCHEGNEVGDADPDAIIIEGNPHGYEGGITVDGRGDHRVIMLESLVALRCRRGLSISGAQHVAKSYPDFFAHLAMLGADVRLESMVAS